MSEIRYRVAESLLPPNHFSERDSSSAFAQARGPILKKLKKHLRTYPRVLWLTIQDLPSLILKLAILQKRDISYRRATTHSFRMYLIPTTRFMKLYYEQIWLLIGRFGFIMGLRLRSRLRQKWDIHSLKR